ncbi:MAG: hypothetical protein EB084_21870 [Proteobacteria bacterium]|nr:hypothetical protein [Pseudomonadota bacterium]
MLRAEMHELIAVLREHQEELLLPVRRGKPLLVLAVECGRSPQDLAAMLDCGVVLDQQDLDGKTALERIVEKDAFGAQHGRELTSSAIRLLSRGARAPGAGIIPGRGNAAATCAAEYHGALAARTLRLAARSGVLPDWLSVVAGFVAR